MRKILFVILLIFHGLISQTNSKSLVGNETVSSDFIQNIFFDEIRLNLKQSDIDAADILNEQKCLLQLQELTKPSYQTILFLDSWGKIPSGILSGHFTDFGNYDQCIKTSVVLVPSHGITNGQYCFASFPKLLQTNAQSERGSLTGLLPSNLKLGVCIPDVCDPKLVTKILEKAVSNVLNGKLSGSTISNCSVAKKPDFKAIDIFAIVFFSLIGVFLLLSTLYDFATVYLERKPVPLLLAFSVKTNGKKLFTINTESSPNSITCLTGIRVISMFWVIHCHNYLFYALLNISNSSDILIWVKNFWSLTILMGTVSVDSFFFLSGLLIAWLGLRELDKTRGKLNIALMYVHRYIRLTPALAAVILFYVTFKNRIGSGPLREKYATMQQGCENSWWINLLYVQNYVHSPFACLPQSWYLAVDTQLYVLSPLMLIPLWRWGKKFIPAVVVLALLSIGCIAATYVVEGYTNLLGFSNKLGILTRTYTKTHTRYSVWLVGIGLGYFMHINRHKTIRLPVVAKLIGWIVSFGIILSIIFLPYFTTGYPYNSTVALAALNESLKRASWAIALSWIVFACHFGFGGLVNSILSHPFWQPLGRLTYCMYLVHMGVQEIIFGSYRTDAYFSDYTMNLAFWSTLGITFLSAIVLSLSFEAPILVIEKSIFGKRKPKPDHHDEALTPPSPPVSSPNKCV